MFATIKKNHHWEDQRGEVVHEEVDYVIVRIMDKYNSDWAYNVRFPRTMIEYEKVIAEA